MNLITKNNLKLFFYNEKNLLKILILYSIICAVLIGNSWDLEAHFLLGKSTLNYLLSFGVNDNDSYTHYRKFYSSSYWALVYFFSQLFSKKLSFVIFKLLNLLIGWFALIGFYKLNKKLFNKRVAIFSFLFLYFHPIFFGHLAINPKDIILAASHIWFFYLVIEYFDKQNNNFNSFKIIFKLSLCIAVATGVQLYFLASLLPIFLFVLLEIFFLKKLINLNFDIKIFFKDVLIIFLLSYLLLIIFWIDAHSNPFIKPIQIFFESFSTYRGWPSNLLNGEMFYSLEASKFYILLMTFFKSPEYILFLSIFFIFICLFDKTYFLRQSKNFVYKIFIFFLIILFPTILLFVNPFPVYDGLRLFLWYVPYTVIFSALSIDYLIINLRSGLSKLIFIFLIFLKVYYLIIFFSYTPYQYTYLNYFSGPMSTKNEKFENDYWGTSLKELLKKVKNEFEPKNEIIKVYMCAIPGWIVKAELKKNNINFIRLTDVQDANYVLLTNRTIVNYNSDKHILLCKDYIKKEIISVNRLGHKLSVFAEIKKNF